MMKYSIQTIYKNKLTMIKLASIWTIDWIWDELALVWNILLYVLTSEMVYFNCFTLTLCEGPTYHMLPESPVNNCFVIPSLV